MFSIGYTPNIKEIFEEFNCYDKVNDVYFSVPHQHMGSAREQGFSKEIFDELIFLKSKGIKLHLVFNSYSYNAEIYNDYDVDNLINIVNMFPLDIITINNMVLLKDLRLHGLSEDIEIKNSVNNKIRTLDDVKMIHNYMGVKSIMLDRSFNRNEDELKLVIAYCKEHNLKTTLLLNEGCIPNCPYKAPCDESISKMFEATDKFSELTCGGDFVKTPEITLKSPFIIPGTLDKYKEMGVDYFKIACRGKTLFEVKERIKAYMFNNKNVSVYNLLDTNPSTLYKSVFTHHLDEHDFYEKTKNCKNKCYECNYCDIIFKTIAKAVALND